MTIWFPHTTTSSTVGLESLRRTELTAASLRSSVAFLAAAALAAVSWAAMTEQDKYALKLPGGVAFADFKGYGDWRLIASAKTDDRMKVILGHPPIIAAFKARIPCNGKGSTADCGPSCHVAVEAMDHIFHPYETRSGSQR
jgi:hypothetical protein